MSANEGCVSLRFLGSLSELTKDGLEIPLAQSGHGRWLPASFANHIALKFYWPKVSHGRWLPEGFANHRGILLIGLHHNLFHPSCSSWHLKVASHQGGKAS